MSNKWWEREELKRLELMNGQYKELLEELLEKNERLERKLKWADEIDLRHNAPVINIPPIPNIIGDKEERISYLAKELKQRDGQYKELLEESERLEKKSKYDKQRIRELQSGLNKRDLVIDSLMEAIRRITRG